MIICGDLKSSPDSSLVARILDKPVVPKHVDKLNDSDDDADFGAAAPVSRWMRKRKDKGDVANT